IFREDGINEAYALEELLPVKRREQPHAGDNVSNRHLGGCLPLVLEVNDLLGSHRFESELLLQPIERGPHFRILIAKALRKLNDKRPVKRLSRRRRLKRRDQLVRLLSGNFQKPVRE